MDIIAELKMERAEKIKEQRKLIDKAENKNRGLSASEELSWNNLDEEIDTLERQIKEKTEERENDLKEFEKELNGGEIMNKKLLTRSEKFTDIVKNRDLGNGKKESELSLGKTLRGLVLGDWSGAESEKRAMDTSGSGQYLIPDQMSANVIDLARSKSVMMRAGARSIPLESNNLSIAKVGSDPSGEWKAEGAAVSAESDMTFEEVNFSAQTLYLLMSFSIELFEDTKADLLDQTVRNAIAEKMALQLDLAALRGDGSGNSPTGILNTSGILNETAFGALGDYNVFSQAMEDIMAQNGTANAAIYAPQVWGVLDRFTDSSGQPLKHPGSFEDLSHYNTTQIPTDLGTGTNETEIYVGDFSQLMFGIRNQLKIEVSRDAKDAFETGKVYLRAYMRADTQLARPEHFKVIEGITLS